MMANPIKYNVSAESLALKKGNFWIGTGDVGKGPTSATGYYAGITPPSSGYTIYQNKASNGPSIYTATNDAELVVLTNLIAGTSYTGANECLVYFAGQSDKMVTNIDYPNIVTSGLVLNLDAGFTPSYARSGTTWTDISGNGNNGTLTNGPTFSSANGGSIVFDGVDDYVLPSTKISIQNSITLSAWIRHNAITSGQKRYITVRSEIAVIRQTDAAGSLQFYIKASEVFQIITVANQLVANTWYNITGTWDGITMVFYRNAIQIGSLTPPGSIASGSYDYTVGASLGNEVINGNIAIAQIYSRALSAQEVLQNYNATKSRFGL